MIKGKSIYVFASMLCKCNVRPTASKFWRCPLIAKWLLFVGLARASLSLSFLLLQTTPLASAAPIPNVVAVAAVDKSADDFFFQNRREGRVELEITHAASKAHFSFKKENPATTVHLE